MKPRTALLLFFASFAAHAAQEITISPAQMAALGVETARVSQAKTAQTHGLPARVVLPNNQLYIVSSPLSGFLDRMAVSVNQSVAKGQVVAVLQSPSLAEAERLYLQERTRFLLARETMQRDKTLFDQGIIAEARFSASKSRYVEEEAALSGQKQILKLSGLTDAAIRTLEENGKIGSTLALRSPIEGVVLEQTAIAGQRVDASAPIYKVARLSPLWLEIEVPAALLPGLKEGDDVTAPAYRAEGKIASMGKSVNPASQTVMVRALMTRSIETLRPGLKVEARISTRSGNMAQIPNSALVRLNGSPAVFVKTKSGFSLHAVEIINEGETESLVSGLKGDESVAVHGVAALKAAISGKE